MHSQYIAALTARIEALEAIANREPAGRYAAFCEFEAAEETYLRDVIKVPALYRRYIAAGNKAAGNPE